MYFNFGQDPGKKDVAFWLWGNSHVEKHRIPFFLHRAYPGAKVVSVVLNGGRFNPSYSFDRVLKKLGWLDRAFILRLDGFREADYVIHLPTYGRQDRSKSMEQEFFPQYPVLMPMVAPPL
ncbi:MAG: hypothetical protein NT099_03410 [Candidatus Saganbacteria bacterium]|nr:hypothetical protein [Candidatus Saganbacteria bacterium]